MLTLLVLNDLGRGEACGRGIFCDPKNFDRMLRPYRGSVLLIKSTIARAFSSEFSVARCQFVAEGQYHWFCDG